VIDIVGRRCVVGLGCVRRQLVALVVKVLGPGISAWIEQAAASSVDARAGSASQVAAATCVHQVRVSVPQLGALRLQLEVLDPELCRPGGSLRAKLCFVEQAERTAKRKLPA